MDTTPCPECGALTVLCLTDPDARPVRFDVSSIKAYTLTKITSDSGSARAIEVHLPHITTCKAINR